MVGCAQAGFTSGQAWQSPNNNFASYNVANQQEEENSLLNHYKKLIGLRNSISQLRTGDISMASNSASSIFSYIRKSTDATPSYLVVHNLAQARDDFPITVSASGLAQGQYVLRDLLTDNSIGQLNVNANGSIDGTAEAVALDGFTSYVMRLELQ